MRVHRLLPVVLQLSLVVTQGMKSAEIPAKFDYAPLDQVLSSYVDPAGKVNYRALKQNRVPLDRMIEQIERASPENAPGLFPDRDAKLAYWINAYNSWILRTVVDHYPITSITKTGRIPYGAFFIMRVTLGEKKMTLRSLENDIIRGRFHDPRIHFAINCASISCPPLAPRVYRPETLDHQLDEAARVFINDYRNVTLDESRHKIVLSKIFDWYATDFKGALALKGKKDPTVVDYLKLYLTPERRQMLERMAGDQINFHEYDWGLNDQVGG
jgi:Protein of unknown function, DUF547